MGESDLSGDYNSDYIGEHLDPEMLAQEQQMIEQQRLVQLRHAQEYHEKRVKQAEQDLAKLKATVTDKQKLIQELIKQNVAIMKLLRRTAEAVQSQILSENGLDIGHLMQIQ